MNTNPAGQSFLSYRRTRKDEARLLICAQHDLGIPTWQDVDNLSEDHTEDQLRRVLSDPSTANAVIWITPDVSTSAVIRKIEVPAILARRQQDDPFFVIPVAAGGLDYKSAADAVDQQISVQDLEYWNLRKVAVDPIGAPQAFELGTRVLQRRINALHRSLPRDVAIRLTLNTRTDPPFQPDVGLSVDWAGRFNGRESTSDSWDNHLLPALKTIVATLHAQAPGRSIAASGFPAIAAATALGAAFLAPAGINISWEQVKVGRPSQNWSLAYSREPSDFRTTTTGEDPSAKDLAVLVSVAANVEFAFAASKRDLPHFRAITAITKEGHPPHDILTPSQAVDVAYVVVEGIRRARDEYRPIDVIHLFMAVPVGLAMMIGQLLNTLGPVQTYEHIPTDATGCYRKSALINPSA
jgi:hypothetical protein